MNSNENSHDPLVERALVGFDLAAEHHIANCEPCQQERERVEGALRQFGAANRECAQRPESFWEQQATRIRAARVESGPKSRLGMALVPSLAVLMLVAFAALHRAPHATPIVNTAPAVVQTDSDHDLLVAVERAVESDTPQALAPVTLMVEEDEGIAPLNKTSEGKETRSHAN